MKVGKLIVNLFKKDEEFDLALIISVVHYVAMLLLIFMFGTW